MDQTRTGDGFAVLPVEHDDDTGEAVDVAVQDGRNTRLIRRQRLALVLVVVCLVAAVGGLVASRFVQSPQEAAASRAAPPASPITATVDKRVLEKTVITRGTVTAGRTVTVAASGGKAGASRAVVTEVPVSAGDEVAPGSVLAEVSGRPVIALPGDTPGYRDLKPGDTGDDVGQLQQALARLGHYQGQPSAVFDAETKRAVRGLYESLNRDVATTGGKGQSYQDKRQAADDKVAQARQAVQDMQQRIAEADSDTKPSGGGAAAAAGGDKGSADGDAAGSESSQGKSLQQQLQSLREKLDEAIERRNQVYATTGAMMPLSEYVFVPTFPARVATLSAELGGKPDGPLMTLSTGNLEITSNLSPDQADMLGQGTRVMVHSELSDKRRTASVAAIGEVTTQPRQSGSAGSANAGSESGSGAGDSRQVAPYVPMTLTPSQPLPARWEGRSVRLTFASARTEKPVLVVPVSAVSTSADGSTTVTVIGEHSQRTRVPVEAGTSADGHVQVSPRTAGQLARGDTVIVGRQR